MAFTTHTPTAPWTTGVSGSGTWAELVTFINNTAIIEKVGDTYIIRGMIEIKATMAALLNSVLINRTNGSWSLASGGSATFGRLVTNASGVSIAVDGCEIIDDVDAYARGADNNANANCWLRSGATLTLYASSYRNKIATLASHLDFASGSNLIVRDSRFTVDSGSNSYDHYQGNVDIDGLVSTHASDNAGSLLELYNGTITKLSNFTPFLNNASSRQCTIWSNKVLLEKWGGDNFSPYNVTGYIQLLDPKSTQLKKVDQNGTPGGSVNERRSIQVLALAGATPVEVDVALINNICQIDTKGTANASGIYSGVAKRRAFPGGSSFTTYGVERTPHMLYARKWGYKTYTTALNVTPNTYAQERISTIAPMQPDSNITLSSTDASLITGVTITHHNKPVTWQTKPYSITVRATSGTSLSNIYHSVAYQASELVTRDSRAVVSFINSDHFFYKTWTGSKGDHDMTMLIVGTHRVGNFPVASQFLGSVGTSTVSMACRAHTSRGLIFQNYTTDLFNDNLLTSDQNASRCTDGGDQLVIAIGRYNATAHTMELWCNGFYVGSAACTIDRGTGTQYVRFGGIANVSSWASTDHIAAEMMVFDRAITNDEVSKLNHYMACKWHMTGTGNIAPGTSVVLNPANYPVNALGNDWTPDDFDAIDKPLFWVSMADPADYTIGASNKLGSIKDKITGTFMTNVSGTNTTAILHNFKQRIIPQLLIDLTTTTRQAYPDGFYRGVRVVDENDNPYPGFTAMQSDDGTSYVPPTYRTLTLNGIKSGSEIRLYKESDMSELAGVESFSNTVFEYTYLYSLDVPVVLVIFALGYTPVYLNLTLQNQNSSIPIQQLIDRNYLNN